MVPGSENAVAVQERIRRGIIPKPGSPGFAGCRDRGQGCKKSQRLLPGDEVRNNRALPLGSQHLFDLVLAAGQQLMRSIFHPAGCMNDTMQRSIDGMNAVQ
ncbi:hypothetical protein D3C73_662710 [compost metagenome]